MGFLLRNVSQGVQIEPVLGTSVALESSAAFFGVSPPSSAQACLGHVTRALQLASRALMCAADDLATKEAAVRNPHALVPPNCVPTSFLPFCSPAKCAGADHAAKEAAVRNLHMSSYLRDDMLKTSLGAVVLVTGEAPLVSPSSVPNIFVRTPLLSFALPVVCAVDARVTKLAAARLPFIFRNRA